MAAAKFNVAPLATVAPPANLAPVDMSKVPLFAARVPVNPAAFARVMVPVPIWATVPQSGERIVDGQVSASAGGQKAGKMLRECDRHRTGAQLMPAAAPEPICRVPTLTAVTPV